MILSEDALRRLYSEEGLTETVIAERYGTHQARVSLLRKRYGIPTISKAERLARFGATQARKFEVETPSKEDLAHLYCGEGLTDAEIAERLGVYQAKVSRWRKTYGIETITHAERLGLPDMTSRQQMLLLGSMLGDGRLLRTGSRTAGYSEYHATTQEEYLRWKAQEWGPFVQSLNSSSTVRGESVFTGSLLRLYGCRQFYPYWQKFYPTGRGAKTFTSISSELTGLALAVWFMDDGSGTKQGYVSFAVSPSETDHVALLGVLDGFGLKARLRRSSSGWSLCVTDRTSISRFLRLVSPHVPPCMRYKLEALTMRKREEAPRDKLTRSRLESMLARGMSVSTIASALSVSTGSVRRGLARHDLKVTKYARSSLYGLEEATSLVEAAGSPEAALEILSRTAFPVRSMSDESLAREVLKLRASRQVVYLDRVGPGGFAGLQLCDHFFGHRFDARYDRLPSLKQAWADPEWLRKAVRYQESAGDPLVPWRVLRALKALLRAPSNFRPVIAKALVEKFCPPDGLVLDPCAGYGGRAAGTLAAGRRYLGVDPHPHAPQAFEGLFRCFSEPGRLLNDRFEATALEAESVDFALTSPPYFSVEQYSDDASQSWVRYPTWEAWVDGFLGPMIQKVFWALRPESTFCLNVSDVKVGSETYPLVETSLRLALDTGFEVCPPISMMLRRFGKSSEPRSEPILVLRKL